MQDKALEPSEQKVPQVNVVEHYIKSISFDSTKNSNDFVGNIEPKINTLINVFATEKKDGQYEVVIQVHADVRYQDEKVFDLKLEYAGLCILRDVPDEDEQKDKVLRIYCAGLIFAFARRVIADVTRDGGYPPMLINGVDFVGLYNRSKTVTNA